VREAERRRIRQATAVTNISRLQGLELTSMINLGGVSREGAEPLADLDEMVAQVADDRPRDAGEVEIRAAPRVREASESVVVAAPELTAAAHPERGPRGGRTGGRGPWLVLAIILLGGVALAAAIGLSGPELPAPRPSAPAAAPR
jgi:hypothetical protein